MGAVQESDIDQPRDQMCWGQYDHAHAEYIMPNMTLSTLPLSSYTCPLECELKRVGANIGHVK